METPLLLLFILEEWKLIGILMAGFAYYFYLTSTFDHFIKKGIKHEKPKIFVGNIGPRFSGKTSFPEFQLEIYNKFKGCRIAGVFEGRRPVYHILDPDLIKAVAIKDFDYFTDRFVFTTNGERYIQRTLINLTGSTWKDIRSILTPTFSGARLKSMLPLIEKCSKQMVQFLKKFDGKEVEMKDLSGRLTLEFIGACAFGITSDAITDENSHFVKVSSKLMYMSPLKRIFFYISIMFVPQLMGLFRLSFFNKGPTEELVRMFRATVEERKQSGEKKNDFLQLLLDAQEKEKLENNGKNILLDDATLDAQCLLFLTAGYESTSSLLAFSAHILATKPEIQKRLRDHIVEVTDGKEMTPEVLTDLTYLEAFILEILRLFPPLARIQRVCVKKYNVPGTSITIDKDEIISIPVLGVHMDPDIYKDPTEFNPERFLGEAKKQVPSHLYLAFGAGPRNCIGYRFTMFTAKIAMVNLVKNYEFVVSPKTEVPLQFHKRSVFLRTANGIWVELKKIRDE